MGTISVKRHGAEILDIVLKYMGQTGIDTVDIGEMPEELEKKEKKQKGETYLITKSMFDSGMSVEAIAKERNLAVSTIFSHLVRFVEQGTLEASQIVEPEKYNEILEYFESTFDPHIGAAREVLGEKYNYGEIKAVLVELHREGFFEENRVEKKY